MNITVSDAFKIASAVLLSVGGSGVLVLLLSGWLGKVWANRLMQNDIAAHAQELEKLEQSDVGRVLRQEMLASAKLASTVR